MRRRKYKGRNGGRRSGATQMTQPVTVMPMAVNWANTASGTHDLNPSVVTNKDSVYRPSSTTVEVACAAPQAFQVVCMANGLVESETATFTVGPTPRRFHVRASKKVDYSNRAIWRYVLTGPGRVTGIATFTLKSAIDTSTLHDQIVQGGDAGSTTVLREPNPSILSWAEEVDAEYPLPAAVTQRSSPSVIIDLSFLSEA